MFEETTTYKRQQQRRGIIAWATGAVGLVLLALSVLVGAGSSSEEADPPNPLGYTMTSHQFEELKPGLGKGAVLDRLGKVGLPEDHVKLRYVRLFPPPGDGVSCSFWEIADEFEEVARICFSDADERLVEKLEHSASEESLGVEA